MSDSTDWKKRLDEVQELKYLLSKAEERPLIEPWAFWVWGALILAATCFQAVYSLRWNWGLTDWFVRLWIPVFAVGGIVETAALVSRIRKDQIPWTSPSFLKAGAGLVGFLFAGSILLIAVLRPDNPLPAVFLLFLAIAFFWIASVTFKKLHFAAVFALVAGTVFLVGNWTGSAAYTASGVLCATIFAGAGFLSRPWGTSRRE